MPHNCKAWAKYADLERSVGETEVIVVAQRLLVIVQILMGEILDRSIFFTEGMVGELTPYIKITQAVRRGDVAVFHSTVSQFALRFKEDGTHTLISRLAHSVVEAGLRKLNASYSRISIMDVGVRGRN